MLCLQPLRQALKKLSVGHLVPETWDLYQSHNIATYLKNLAQLSKQESDRIMALVGRLSSLSSLSSASPHASANGPPLTIVPKLVV